jgi:hypothetical protein
MISFIGHEWAAHIPWYGFGPISINTELLWLTQMLGHSKTPMRILASIACLLIACGCANAPHGRPATSVVDDRAHREIRNLEIAIEGIQEEVDILKQSLQKRRDAMGGAMGPAWQERLRSARESIYTREQYVNDLRATKAILSRKLEALTAEQKVYTDYLVTDSFGKK